MTKWTWQTASGAKCTVCSAWASCHDRKTCASCFCLLQLLTADMTNQQIRLIFENAAQTTEEQMLEYPAVPKQTDNIATECSHVCALRGYQEIHPLQPRNTGMLRSAHAKAMGKQPDNAMGLQPTTPRASKLVTPRAFNVAKPRARNICTPRTCFNQRTLTPRNDI